MGGDQIAAAFDIMMRLVVSETLKAIVWAGVFSVFVLAGSVVYRITK